MRLQLLKYWNRVRESFWFTPGTMAVAAVVLAFVSVTVDEPVSTWLADNAGWTFKTGAEGASAVLQTIAGSMITIAGVVFSMTLVVLSLASAQLGPRLLRNFMSDVSTQVVLGTFIATFVYCLLVLRTIRFGDGEAEFVPHLSVSLGVVLAVVSVGVLIYFIHHISISIQSNEMAARIGGELNEKVQQLFPERIGSGGPVPMKQSDAGLIGAFDRESQAVRADGDGYLQFIDAEALLALALEHDLVVRLEQKHGSYVVAGCAVVSIWPGRRVTDKLAKQVRSHFVLGNQRTSDQDFEFGINQLVEMAVRALSPGISDPFTAIACVDHLGSALCRLALRDMPSPYRYDSQDQLRLIVRVDTYPQILDAAFDQIRQSSRSSAALTLRLLETIAVIAGFVHRPADRAALLRHAEMIARGAREVLPEHEDRRMVEERWQTVTELCSEPTATLTGGAMASGG